MRTAAFVAIFVVGLIISPAFAAEAPDPSLDAAELAGMGGCPNGATVGLFRQEFEGGKFLIWGADNRRVVIGQFAEGESNPSRVGTATVTDGKLGIIIWVPFEAVQGSSPCELLFPKQAKAA